jgi:hypothetical protein
MNTSTLVITTLCLMAIGYRFYAALFAREVLGIGERYVAAPAWITAGHRLPRPRKADRERTDSSPTWSTADHPVAAH